VIRTISRNIAFFDIRDIESKTQRIFTTFLLRGKLFEANKNRKKNIPEDLDVSTYAEDNFLYG
jgi:hypothetical protein